MTPVRCTMAALTAAAAVCAVPAHAAKLYSVWTLVPEMPTGQVEVAKDAPFLVQRLLPYEAVRLEAPAIISAKSQLAAGTVLFKVYQADGKAAYCTLKDQSAGNVAKSLFIPALDKRPCLVDADEDGAFDKSFSVFDKFGSALTPSGNLDKAKPMAAAAAYSPVSPDAFPSFRGFSFQLENSTNPAKRRIAVSYDNGSGYSAWQNQSNSSTPEQPAALNLRLTEIDVVGERVGMNIELDPQVFILGMSDGFFFGGPLPPFVKKAS